MQPIVAILPKLLTRLDEIMISFCDITATIYVASVYHALSCFCFKSVRVHNPSKRQGTLGKYVTAAIYQIMCNM